VKESLSLYAKCSDLILFLGEELCLPENVIERAFNLLDKIFKDSGVRLKIQRSKPAGIVSGLIYLAAKQEGEWLTQIEIVKALNGAVTSATLRNNYKKLIRLMNVKE